MQALFLQLRILLLGPKPPYSANQVCLIGIDTCSAYTLVGLEVITNLTRAFDTPVAVMTSLLAVPYGPNWFMLV